MSSHTSPEKCQESSLSPQPFLTQPIVVEKRKKKSEKKKKPRNADLMKTILQKIKKGKLCSS